MTGSAGATLRPAPCRASRRYPRLCYEEKRYPDGRRNRFRARVLLLRPGHGVLHFVSHRAYDLGGIYLPRGTVTFGLFWEDRPYNLYAWMAPDLAAPRALYFNVCDQVALTADRFDWRDLWVDVLVTPHGCARRCSTGTRYRPPRPRPCALPSTPLVGRVQAQTTGRSSPLPASPAPHPPPPRRKLEAVRGAPAANFTLGGHEPVARSSDSGRIILEGEFGPKGWRWGS